MVGAMGQDTVFSIATAAGNAFRGDLQGYDYTDTCAGSVWEMGPHGSPRTALTLDGASGHVVSVPYNASLNPGVTDAFTMCAWVKVGAVAGEARVVVASVIDGASEKSGYWLGLTREGKVQWRLGTSTAFLPVTTTATVTAGTWHHVCGGYDPTGADDGGVVGLHGAGWVSLDGVVRRRTQLTVPFSPMSDAAVAVTMGGGVGGVDGLTGALGEVRLYVRALREVEVGGLFVDGGE
jgi:hypothetical protein